MTDFEKDCQQHQGVKSSAKELDKTHRRRWKRHIKIRAAKIKRQLQIENRFHKSMREVYTTTDRYRRSYLRWILQHMFSLFDYETGLHAINDKVAYKSWLHQNKLDNKNNY